MNSCDRKDLDSCRIYVKRFTKIRFDPVYWVVLDQNCFSGIFFGKLCIPESKGLRMGKIAFGCFIVFILVAFCHSSTDIQRPQFHALPPSNWINDPNGPIYYENHYHLFFQYNPNAAVWGNISWGHMRKCKIARNNLAIFLN